MVKVQCTICKGINKVVSMVTSVYQKSIISHIILTAMKSTIVYQKSIISHKSHCNEIYYCLSEVNHFT